ncbi:HAD-IIB family hydrolase [uncultured Desulfosarcina sp.]|uniref:HAD-IIB family hydrolase n=1 Tax=uncultured Desulfosarcina sp. TaxID=218289 RepID=UPI0029C7EF6D|nr:HAD-IIB family hydrolase [uncultured Desulfosarcina sp.]
MKTILLCSDLDRTLIPNGAEDESPQARPLFAGLAAHPHLRLAYVSGRDKNLVKKAIVDFDLPEPDFVIGDVGTTLYHVDGNQWHMNPGWQHEIARDWHGHGHDDITALLADMKGKDLELQAPEKQNRYKISYYTAPSINPRTLRQQVTDILNNHQIAAHIIWSRDEAEQRGLLDILPRRANKLQAIRFLMADKAFEESNTVFAGDSGNDLDVLVSGLPAILVKNAADDVRQSALNRLAEEGINDRLYLARGGFKDMNGNYAAGVLEGIVHFFPATAEWINSANHTVG